MSLVLQQCFTLPVTPVAKGRPRTRIAGGHATIYTPGKTATAEAAIRALLEAARPLCYPKGVPVALRVTFGVPRPKDAPRREHYVPRRPDLPNYLMLICDAGTGLLWADDSQIVTIEASKEHMDTPRVVLAVGVPLSETMPPPWMRMAWEATVLQLLAATNPGGTP